MIKVRFNFTEWVAAFDRRSVDEPDNVLPWRWGGEREGWREGERKRERERKGVSRLQQPVIEQQTDGHRAESRPSRTLTADRVSRFTASPLPDRDPPPEQPTSPSLTECGFLIFFLISRGDIKVALAAFWWHPQEIISTPASVADSLLPLFAVSTFRFSSSRLYSFVI